ncbi:hypothetical protein PPSIR1_19164 [Plesiocystis pacifica SIR-1]|uniref:Uncharacterized protein n=1 Tax=Plesiocystis pacifica SIR-1 TaxID=391625 RepID=A6G7Z8_9BACT|nr:hypothetical protein [Plesiocystis pacifica]EDM77960.1 hypothetical protein PPSIR1_19164 [Plesiocystis pacifica SIR-1]
MGLFSRFRRSPAPEAPGRVVVVSEGLERFGQRELAFAVQLRPGESGEAVRAELEQLIAAIRSHAEQGQLVHAGGFTAFGAPGFLSSRTQGIVYANAGSGDPELPESALAAVLVDPDELRVAQAGGASRILARLGQLSSQYPFPQTNDRDRPSVARPGEDSSLVFQTARASVPGVSLLLAHGVLRIRVRPSARPALRQLLEASPDDAAFALLTAPDAAANAQLVWFPGQGGPSAITPPGSQGELVTGGMLVVASGQERDEVRIHEDGFAWLAHPSSWERARACLLAGEALDMPLADPSFDLRIETLAEGFLHYLPVNGAPDESLRITLLTPDEALRQAVDIEVLSRYAKAVLAAMTGLELGGVHVTLAPGEAARVEGLGVDAGAVETVRAVEAPSVRAGVAFEVHAGLG